jgi:hypothetical protein
MEDRYMVPALAAAAFFFASGVEWLAGRVPLRGLPRTGASALLSAALLAVFFAITFQVPPRLHYGFDQIAEITSPGAVLVSSEHNGEGMLVAEVAMRDPKRPSRYVVRASKLFADARWSGAGYTPVVASPEAVRNSLSELGILQAAVDLGPGKPLAHHRFLRAALAGSADWTLTQKLPGNLFSPGIELYRYTGDRARPFSPDRLAAKLGAPGLAEPQQ